MGINAGTGCDYMSPVSVLGIAEPMAKGLVKCCIASACVVRSVMPLRCEVLLCVGSPARGIDSEYVTKPADEVETYASVGVGGNGRVSPWCEKPTFPGGLDGGDGGKGGSARSAVDENSNISTDPCY